MTKTENYNYGGVSVALRWLLWLVPFWLLAMMPLLERWHPGRWGRGLCVLAVVPEHVLGMVSAERPVEAALVVQPADQRRLDRLFRSSARRKPPPYHSWIRTLPATTDDAPQADYWIEFAGLDGDGQLTRLRLADAGGVEVDGRQRSTHRRHPDDGRSAAT